MRGVWRLEQQVAEQKQKNEQLRRSNEKLSADLEDLKTGKEAIEERARSELGLVKPGEVFYHVVEPARWRKEGRKWRALTNGFGASFPPPGGGSDSAVKFPSNIFRWQENRC